MWQIYEINHYEIIAVTYIAELFATAYNRVATIEKGINGFKTTGLYPTDTNVFKEKDFIQILDLPTATVIYMNILALVVSNTSPSAIISLVAGPSDWTSIN